MGRNKRKYKKLFRDLNFYRSEIDYQQEILTETHVEFDSYYQQFCSERKIDIGELNQKNAESLEKMIPTKGNSFKEGNKIGVPKVFSKIYKSIAARLHPDKFPHLEESEKMQKEESFKKLSFFFENQDWTNLIRMAEEENVDFLISNELITFMKKEVNYLKKEVDENETKFSWKFYNCEHDEGCKAELIKQFLKQMHNLEVI
jgi:hypothetical protein